MSVLLNRKYEKQICIAIGGTIISGGRRGEWNVLAPNRDILEVKGSQLRDKRWHWNCLVGLGMSPKTYDYLILVGESTRQETSEIINHYFIVPYLWAVEFAMPRQKSLYCAYERSTVGWSWITYELWTRFKFSIEELKEIFS